MQQLETFVFLVACAIVAVVFGLCVGALLVAGWDRLMAWRFRRVQEAAEQLQPPECRVRRIGFGGGFRRCDE